MISTDALFAMLEVVVVAVLSVNMNSGVVGVVDAVVVDNDDDDVGRRWNTLVRRIPGGPDENDDENDGGEDTAVGFDDVVVTVGSSRVRSPARQSSSSVSLRSMSSSARSS